MFTYFDLLDFFCFCRRFIFPMSSRKGRHRSVEDVNYSNGRFKHLRCAAFSGFLSIPSCSICELPTRSFGFLRNSGSYPRLARLPGKIRAACSNFRAYKNEPIGCICIVLPENQSQLTLTQASPELFSPSVMHKREELWGREWLAQYQKPEMNEIFLGIVAVERTVQNI